ALGPRGICGPALRKVARRARLLLVAGAVVQRRRIGQRHAGAGRSWSDRCVPRRADRADRGVGRRRATPPLTRESAGCGRVVEDGCEGAAASRLSTAEGRRSVASSLQRRPYVPFHSFSRGACVLIWFLSQLPL